MNRQRLNITLGLCLLAWFGLGQICHAQEEDLTPIEAPKTQPGSSQTTPLSPSKSEPIKVSIAPPKPIVYHQPTPEELKKTQQKPKIQEAPHSPEQYHPEKADLHKSSTLAMKTYSDANTFDTKNAYTGIKSYFSGSKDDIKLGRPLNLTSSSTLKIEPYQNASTPYSSISSYQFEPNKIDPHASLLASLEGTKTVTTHSSPYSSKAGYTTSAFNLDKKKYDGPEVVIIKRDMESIAQKLTNAENLPNRPLTIDEVRDLLNHDIKPQGDKSKTGSSLFSTLPQPEPKTPQPEDVRDTDPSIPLAPGVMSEIPDQLPK